MYHREFNGIACIAEYLIEDRKAIIPQETLDRLHKQFLWKPLYARPDLAGHGDWSYQFQIGTITRVEMVGQQMRVRGLLHKHIPTHTTETLGLSIDSELPNDNYGRKQYYGIHFKIPWSMDSFKPKGITVLYQHLAAIPCTTFNLY